MPRLLRGAADLPRARGHLVRPRLPRPRAPAWRPWTENALARVAFAGALALPLRPRTAPLLWACAVAALLLPRVAGTPRPQGGWQVEAGTVAPPGTTVVVRWPGPLLICLHGGWPASVPGGVRVMHHRGRAQGGIGVSPRRGAHARAHRARTPRA